MYRSDVASPPSAPAHQAVRDSEFRVPHSDAVPALPSSALSAAWRQQAGTRQHSESMRGRSVRPAGSTPARRVGKSTERVIGIGRLHTYNYKSSVMFYMINITQVLIAALRGIDSFDCAAAGRETMDRFELLLCASFRPHLTVTPLRFAITSPPSGREEDLHLQAVDHARHTKQNRPRLSA